MTATFRESGRDSDIPRIAPVAVGVERPLWSVMIPTFNCAQYLRHTLKSVLAQDPGPKHMQIEVVDDASTKDDPEAVVKEIAGDRVLFYRKEKNGGAIANFNTCVERSVGRLVHLLHGDDTVEPGFYAAFAAAFENSPGCAAVYSRVFVIDEENDLLGLSDYMPSLKRESTDARELMLTNPIRTPGVVIRRQFYEENGGFQPALVHTADWEMWARSVLHGGARMLNRPLASYRSFGANDLSRLMQTAENVRDHLRLGAIWEARGMPGFDRAAFDRMVYRLAFAQWRRFSDAGNADAAATNYAFLREHCPTGRRIWMRLRSQLVAIKRFVNHKVE